MIDPGRAIFIWEGKLPPLVMGDFSGWAGLEMEAVGPNLWTRVVELPRGAYCEYMLLLEGTSTSDPYNRRRTPNGFGKYNHWFYMPGGSPAPETHRRQEIKTGSLRTFYVETADILGSGKRKVVLYMPPTEKPAVLAVVYDGAEYLGRGRLNVICDNLIAEGRIDPLALAFIDHHPKRRALEYACSEGTLAFITQMILPLAQREMNLIAPTAEPGRYGVIGASFGGLMALYTGLRLPGIFGRVVAQSGAYTLHGHRFPVWDLARVPGIDKPRVWMDAGSFEHLLTCNREMDEHLRDLSFDVHYQEYEGGHNYTVWRNDLPGALAWGWGE